MLRQAKIGGGKADAARSVQGEQCIAAAGEALEKKEISVLLPANQVEVLDRDIAARLGAVKEVGQGCRWGGRRHSGQSFPE